MDLWKRLTDRSNEWRGKEHIADPKLIDDQDASRTPHVSFCWSATKTSSTLMASIEGFQITT